MRLVSPLVKIHLLPPTKSYFLSEVQMSEKDVNSLHINFEIAYGGYPHKADFKHVIYINGLYPNGVEEFRKAFNALSKQINLGLTLEPSVDPAE